MDYNLIFKIVHLKDEEGTYFLLFRHRFLWKCNGVVNSLAKNSTFIFGPKSNQSRVYVKLKFFQSKKYHGSKINKIAMILTTKSIIDLDSIKYIGCRLYIYTNDGIVV